MIKMTEKQKLEKDLFDMLDKECARETTPIPDKLIFMRMKCEILGIMSFLLCEAFAKMRETNGQSNWEFDAKIMVGNKKFSKTLLTLNALRKYLSICQGANLIEYSKEVDNEIIVKVNALFLFSEEEE